MNVVSLPLSLCIIARNESANLRRCIGSVRSLVSEIIVVINDCTDDTAEVARSLGAKVYEHRWHGDTEQRNIALQHATEPWILVLDADEVVSPELAQSIQVFFAKYRYDHEAASFPRRTEFLGKWIWHGDWYPDRLVRLFRAGVGRTMGLDRHPYIQLLSGTKVKRLKGDLLHYSFQSLTHQLLKIPSFADCHLRHQLANKQEFSVAEAIFRSVWRFFRAYVLRLGFLDGYRGFYIAFFTAFATLFRYSRLFEHSVKPEAIPLFHEHT